MKRFIAILMALVLISVTLSACGKSTDNENKKRSSDEETQETYSQTEISDEEVFNEEQSTEETEWTCDRCHKTWQGDAYYGSDYSDTLCADCAEDYWSPLPISSYKKEQSISKETWTCDRCHKTWQGDAYYGSDYSDTLCADCAEDYWSPLPISSYKK